MSEGGYESLEPLVVKVGVVDRGRGRSWEKRVGVALGNLSEYLVGSEPTNLLLDRMNFHSLLLLEPF